MTWSSKSAEALVTLHPKVPMVDWNLTSCSLPAQASSLICQPLAFMVGPPAAPPVVRKNAKPVT